MKKIGRNESNKGAIQIRRTLESDEKPQKRQIKFRGQDVLWQKC